MVGTLLFCLETFYYKNSELLKNLYCLGSPSSGTSKAIKYTSSSNSKSPVSLTRTNIKHSEILILKIILNQTLLLFADFIKISINAPSPALGLVTG